MIRQMQQGDIGRIEEIWLNESIRVHGFIPEDFWRGKGLTNFRSETLAADAYVYEDKGLIKGFMTMKYNYIHELFVEVQWQRRGIGTALLDLAKRCSTSLYLHVYVRNFEAINWYLGRGFLIANKHEPQAESPNHLKYVMVWTKALTPTEGC